MSPAFIRINTVVILYVVKLIEFLYDDSYIRTYLPVGLTEM